MDGPHGHPSALDLAPAVQRSGTVDFSRPHDDTTANLTSQTDRMSLALPRKLGDDRRRESTQDSADQAEGIFGLYERDRDSWLPQGRDPGHEEPIVEREEARYSVPAAIEMENREDLVEPTSPKSQRSWEGPFSALAQPSPTAPAFPPTATTDPAHVNGGDPGHLSRRSSTRANGAVPSIIRTPDKTLQARFVRQDRDSTLSTSTSTSTNFAPSPTPSPAQGVRRTSGRYASAGGPATMSQVSVAASSQYPGEDNDAFHVRSTYARLEAEGVHGDGWDPGVERTRGGPQQGRRATVLDNDKTGDVGETEREFLASLDRYGFINEPLRNRSETRLALIPSAPLLKIPKIPAKSPIPPGTAAPAPNTAFGTQEGPSPKAPQTPKKSPGDDERLRRREDERVGKWMKMMSVRKRDQGGNTVEWGWKGDTKTKMVKRVYKGIPDRWRMAAWWTMAEEAVGGWKGKGRETRGAAELAQEYRRTIDLPSSHDVQIDLDVPRTISGHTQFITRYGAGQRSLFHVLHCFSLLCDECGYCQGMGPIAATLLCYFDPERVYTLLVRLHDVYGMHSIFAPGFPGLLEAFYVQERLIEYLMPDLYKSFQRNMISSSAWGTKWYITLFVNTVPFSQQLRLWDALWLQGRDVMIVTSIAILWSFKDLLSAPNATFESILSLLSSYFVAEDEDALLRFIRKFMAQQGVKQRMDEWRADWHRLVREGKDGTALL